MRGNMQQGSYLGKSPFPFHQSQCMQHCEVCSCPENAKQYCLVLAWVSESLISQEGACAPTSSWSAGRQGERLLKGTPATGCTAVAAAVGTPPD